MTFVSGGSNRLIHGLLPKLGPLLPVVTGIGVIVGGDWWLGLGIPVWQHSGGMAWLPFNAWLWGSIIVGVVLHEFGHALVGRLMGGSVQAIELGGKLGRVRFRVGKTEVSVGLGLGGQVLPGLPELPPGRQALTLAAGPTVNLLLAPASLLLPIPWPDAARIGVVMLSIGLGNLAPGRLAGDGTTDGWKLVFLPARVRASAQVRELVADPDWCGRPDAFDVLVKAVQLSVPEAADLLMDLRDRPETVPRLFRQPWPMPPGPVPVLAELVYALTFLVVSDGQVPAETADLAAERAEWAVKHARSGSWDGDKNVAGARSVLAVVRLRQGRPEEAERLGAKALRSELDPDDRATALATVAMARHAQLLSGREQLDEALRLDPDAPMVSEAARLLDNLDAGV